jgi:ligand-binding sensor domain-containing protein
LRYPNVFMNKQLLIFFYFLFCYCFSAISQNIAIGEWREHLPYNIAHTVTEGEDVVYCATNYAVFSYRKTDNSISRFSKINSLAETGISTIKYHTNTQALIVGYNSGNIDLLFKDKTINVSAIKNATILSSKRINKIEIINDLAYLCTGFGIVVMNVAKAEIQDSYIIGENGKTVNVYALAKHNNRFFAATAEGIYDAPVNAANLADYNFWKKQSALPNAGKPYNTIISYAGKLISSYKDAGYNKDTLYSYNGTSWSRIDSIIGTGINSIELSGNNLLITHNDFIAIYDSAYKRITHTFSYQTSSGPLPKHAISGKDGIIWIADAGQGLILNVNPFNNLSIIPSGPTSAMVENIIVKNGEAWATPGVRVRSNGANTFAKADLMHYKDGTWRSYRSINSPKLDTIFDIISVAADPSNSNKVFAGSLGRGVLEFNNGFLTKIYKESNSPLSSVSSWYWVGIGGLAFDSNNNLWIANTDVENPIKVKKADGSWKTISNSIISGASNTNVWKLFIDKSDRKWIVTGGNGIIAYTDNGTIDNLSDDKAVPITSGSGKGNLPSNMVNAIAEDLDGEIWLGTFSGIAVIYSPANVFSGGNYDAQQILINIGGYYQNLLETEVVTAIAVDGANRKWIGTASSGVFLMSEDGTQQLKNFTKHNSPLFSNNITCISIDDESGEVFFGTEEGLISYRSDATEGNENYSSVYSFPNPVPAEYEGPIAIKGLIKNSEVKITDINGNIVFRTISLGGQAIWNGRAFNGEKVSSGVYLVFLSDTDGLQYLATKILFIK